MFSTSKVNVLAFIHWGFFDQEPYAKRWLQDWIQLSEYSITLFDPVEHRVQDFDVLHVFSQTDPMIGVRRQMTGTAQEPVRVWTPALYENSSLGFLRRKPGERLVRACRMLTQRTFYPQDQDSWVSSLDGILVPQASWNSELSSRYQISRQEIGTFHNSHGEMDIQVSEEISRFYLRLLDHKKKEGV